MFWRKNLESTEHINMHVPVLLKEVIENLNLNSGDTILDATINGGGHAKAIIKKIGESGRLIGIEQDTETIENFKPEKKLILANENFRNLDKVLEHLNIKEINGALFDLGISSLQLDESGRGFTFQKDEPLLMTFKAYPEHNDLTAEKIVNHWREKEIADVLYKYGEERYSRRIAKRIVESRKIKKIKTTFDLVGLIRSAVPSSYRHGKINCATRTFQALRIMVNDELNALKEGLEKAWQILDKEGRMVVISFHSLEDRIVKKNFRELANSGKGKIITKKPIAPSQEEKQENPRSRSAKLRAIEKL